MQVKGLANAQSCFQQTQDSGVNNDFIFLIMFLRTEFIRDFGDEGPLDSLFDHF